MTALLFETEPERPSKLAPPERSKPALPRDYFSYSSIRAYQQCPLRYFFHYIAGIPEETISAALVFSRGIHRAIEYHFRRLLETSAAATLEELLLEYWSEWQEQSVPVQFSKDEQAASFDNLAKRMLAAFAASALAKSSGTILAVEEPLRGEVIPGLPDLLGKVGLILETPNELVISDWKTSRAKYTQDQVDESAAQLLLYGELARDFAPSKRLRLQFGVLTKTKEISIDVHNFPPDPVQLDRTKRVIERVWRAIQSEHFYPVPSQINCSSCPYRNSCRAWTG